MQIWSIHGGRRLEGACSLQGSKNAVLPILAASVLCPAVTVLERVPALRDVDTAIAILRYLGCEVEREGERVTVDSRLLTRCDVPESYMVQMRSSVFFLGSLLARTGEVSLCRPGGCRLGKRPIDIHLSALRQLGAEIREEEDGALLCRAEKLRGRNIVLPFPSVGATENLLMAACAAEGKTVIRNAAREPEVTALGEYLRTLGADISGLGTETVTVEGFSPRVLVTYTVPPDRMVAATLLCAVAATGGTIRLEEKKIPDISSLLHFLNEAGCDIIKKDTSLTLCAPRRLRAVSPVVTAPYPGFPTDAQPLLMAALLCSEGESSFTETIFENRYRHVRELCRMGADISLCGNRALVRGVPVLEGCEVAAEDLRGGAALVLAGLSAGGETRVTDPGYIARGYEALSDTLCALGADITRIP